MCHFLAFPIPVVVRYCFSDKDVVAALLAAIPIDGVHDGRWLLDDCSTHEHFLNMLPSMNPYTSQVSMCLCMTVCTLHR